MSTIAKLRNRGAMAPWGLVTELSILGMSLLTFLVIGDRLGPDGFGALAAVLATIALVGPLLTASPEHVIVQRIARGTNLGDAWARSLAVLLSVGPIAAICMLLVAVVVAPTVSVQAVVLISLGEIMLLGITRVAILAHEASEGSRLGAQVAIVNLITRVGALLAFLFFDGTTVDDWSIYHVVSSVVAAAHAHWTMRAAVRTTSFTLRPTMDDYRTGVPFALTAGPDELLSNNDKIVLSGSGLSVDAGIYAAAYRIASIANVPARSIVRPRYASYFKPENQSPRASVANALSILRATLPAGVLSCVALFATAPLVELWNEEYKDSVTALRYLAFLPIVRSIATPGANVLTGTGRQRLRIIGTTGAGCLNLVLNLIFIPSHGWRAAVVTTLVAEVLLLVWAWYHVLRPQSRPPVT